MKKYLFFLSVTFLLFNQNSIFCMNEDQTLTKQELIGDILDDIEGTNFNFDSLSFWAKTRYATSITLGALCGNLLAVAFMNLFGSNQKLATFKPSQWTFSAFLGTIAGCATAEYFSRYAEFPQYRIKEASKELLLVILMAQDDSDALIKGLNDHFAIKQYPLMEAYNELYDIHATLETSLLIMEKNQKFSKKSLIRKIKMMITCIEKALVILKNNPLFYQQQLNYNLIMSQASQNHHYAGTNATYLAVSLAHSGGN